MSIIPAPLFVENREGQHTLVDQVRIACDGKGTDAVGQYLADHLELRYEHQSGVDIAEPSSSAGAGDILLTRVTEPLESLADLAVPSEAYELEVAEDGIFIRALENHGLFNGVQTLIQLLPATATLDALSLQCVKARAMLLHLHSNHHLNTCSIQMWRSLLSCRSQTLQGLHGEECCWMLEGITSRCPFTRNSLMPWHFTR